MIAAIALEHPNEHSSPILSAVVAAIAAPLMGIIVMAPIMYLGMLLIGIPALLVLHRIELERWWAYGAWGFILSELLLPLFLPRAFWLSPAGGLILIFWAIARRGRSIS
jgi:hypothetical protein